MVLLYFFIGSWVLITIILFIYNRGPLLKNEKRSTFILEIITLSTLLTIAEVVIVFIVIAIGLGIFSLFGVIG